MKGKSSDPARVLEMVTPRTRAVVLTDLHNPSGTMLGPVEAGTIGEIARRHGIAIVVDEIYKEFLRPPATLYRSGGPFIATSGVGKAFGLGPLRIGWILGPPPFIERCRRLNDLIVVNPPGTSARIAAEVLRRSELFAGRLETIIRGNLPRLLGYLEARDLPFVRPAGPLVFPRIPGVEDTLHFCESAFDRFDLHLVPGEFFSSPGHIRLSATAPPDRLEEALEALDAALAEVAAR